MTLSDFVVPTYVQMLGALSQWLSKAEAQRQDGSVDTLLAARLAPDMFPLATQVRFACRQAQEAVFRLLDQEFPPALEALLDEGRNAGERPGTLADAPALIDETIAVVKAAAVLFPCGNRILDHPSAGHRSGKGRLCVAHVRQPSAERAVLTRASGATIALARDGIGCQEDPEPAILTRFSRPSFVGVDAP